MGELSENTGFAVDAQLAQGAGFKTAAQLARSAGYAFFHAVYPGRHHFAGGQGQHLAGIHVADRVAKAAEGFGLRVIEGEGSDAGGAVPHP